MPSTPWQHVHRVGDHGQARVRKKAQGATKRADNTPDKSIEIGPSSGRTSLGRAGLETLKDRSGGVRGQDEGSRAN